MQNNEYVYFLSVKQAMELAKKHEDEDDWDFWTDSEVQLCGAYTFLISIDKRKARSAS